MIKLYKIFIALIAFLICSVILTQSGIIKPAKPIYTPARSIAALGDSITKAANACEPWQECEEASWSTGTIEEVNSISSRIEKLPNIEAKDNEKLIIKRFNNAKSYSKSNDLINQATVAITQKPELVTILTGANDICVPTLSEMTSPQSYKDNVEEALQLIQRSLPKAKILIASVPNIYTLWEAGRNNLEAITKWEEASLCPTMLSNPTSNDEEDVLRRQTALDRIKEYNNILKQLCASIENCKFDNNRIFNTQFTVEDISEVDYFHPSLSGQQKLADSFWDSEMPYYSTFNRGSAKRSSLDAPIVTIIQPEDGETLSGANYLAKVEIESKNKIERVYADTQIGGVELYYNKVEDYWYLELDTTLAPNGLKTFFSIVAVDEKQGISISDTVNVTVDNRDYNKIIPEEPSDFNAIIESPEENKIP